MSKQKLKFLIYLNLFWGLIAFYADYAWLSNIPLHLVPLTAICSLYPPLLTIWYLLQYYQKPVPHWFTYWIAVGAASYGLMAQIYFPLLMSWKGINFHDAGSMFWVAVYGYQSILLLPYLKGLKAASIIPGIAFLAAADLTMYLGRTFVDFTLPGYPLWIETFTVIAAITLQISTAITFYHLSTLPKKLLQESEI